jgi:metallophosphoesterase (TIGR00282 family)
MRILFIGDVIGRPGRAALRKRLPSLRKDVRADFVIANGENMAGGAGITLKSFREVVGAGVDVVTGGNHTWRVQEVLSFIDEEPNLLRPANYPPHADVPGRGGGVFEIADGRRIGVLNLCGRVNLGNLEDPFPLARREAEALRAQTPTVLIDFHAEVTSEKIAFSWYLDGRVSAVVGTHTHVQTADERVLPGGTAHISDVGMTGPHDSVLGVDKEIIIEKFLTQMPRRHEIARGDVRISGVVIETDDASGRALSIERICEPVEL